MTEALPVSNAVLWGLVVLLACVVAALARQIGVLPQPLELALRGAARRGGRRPLARARQHARAPREPVRGQGARRGVDPGFPPRRRGGPRGGGATMTDGRPWLDRLCERAARQLARRTSRR